MALPIPPVQAIDTETTGLAPHGSDTMFSYSLCDWDGKTSVHRLDGGPIRQTTNHANLDKFWSDTSIEKTMFNAKFDTLFCEKKLGKRLAEQSVIHDSYIMSHLLRSDRKVHKLKELAWELAGIPRDDEQAIHAYVRGVEENFSHVPEHLMEIYQHRDAERTMLMHRYMYPQIQANPKFLEIYKMEMDLIKVTMRMEKRGMMIHRQRTLDTMAKLEKDLALATQEFVTISEKITGQRIFPGQTAKVSKLLFKYLKLPDLADGSTSKDDVLLPLREQHPHPIIDLLLKCRSWKHGVSMLASYLDYADDTDTIHPSINTCGAGSTGRESCSKPNLQNVEKDGNLKNPFPSPARLCFRPRPDHILIPIDYAGQEMRWIVHISGDKRMLAEFNRVGSDPHSLAAGIFYPPFTEEEERDFHFVNDAIRKGFSAFKKGQKEFKMLRDSAKNTNFAKPYGCNFVKAGFILGIPEPLSKKRCAEYDAMFPDLVGCLRNGMQEVRECGYTTNDFGRRLYINPSEAYMWLNYRAQSDGAEVTKRAQVRVHKYLREATSEEVGILLAIHDEILIEYPRKRLKDIGDIMGNIHKLMTTFPEASVPMEIEAKLCTVSWAQKRELVWKGVA